jgi:putative transposase
MKIRKAFKFRLKIKSKKTIIKLVQFAGCQRFVWNKALALKKETYEKTKENLNYYQLSKMLTRWKKEEETSFLKETSAQSLQQTLKDLESAYKDFFRKKASFPKFKKKNVHDSFRFPQGVKVEGSTVSLPKIGKLKFFKSREIEGKIKNTTVSRNVGNWFVSFQVEMDIEEPKHPSKQITGIDLGVAKFATLSTGNVYEGFNSFRKLESKLAKEQRKISRKKKFSNNWKKQKKAISAIHSKIADIRKDRLHWISNTISKNHAMIVLEDLQVSNMSKSAKGTMEKPGKNVKVKSRLNKSILDQGWFEFKRQLEYKQLWRGGRVVLVPAHHTSQICSKCGRKDEKNRQSQAKFECIKCGNKENADVNAAKNILKRAVGQTVSACGDISAIAC